MDNKQIGLQIKKGRIDSGLTQQELGEKIGVTWEMISRYENGRTNPLTNLLDIAKHLNKPITFFFGVEDESFQNQLSKLKKLLDQKDSLSNSRANIIFVPVINYKKGKSIPQLIKSSKVTIPFSANFLSSKKNLFSLKFGESKSKESVIGIFTDTKSLKKSDLVLQKDKDGLKLDNYSAKNKKNVLGKLLCSMQIY